MRRRIAALILLLTLPAWAGFKAIGKVTVSSSGTPVQVYKSSSSAPSTSPLIRARVIIIQAPSDDVGPFIYVGDSTLVKSSRVGVAAVLQPGQSITLQSPGDANLNPEELWVDADNSGDSVQVSVIQ